MVENDEYAAFARRVLRAYARRVADGDVEALTLMLGLSAEIDDAIAQAVQGLRGFGYSWAEIGSRLGITRQAAQQRWGAQAMTRHEIPPEDPARAAAWLLAEYDATDIEELADSIGAVQARRTICVLKTLLDGGSPMRVTAPDYHDPDRWWL